MGFRAKGARVLAHRNVAIQAAKDTTITDRDWHRTPLAADAMPTDAFDDKHEITLGADRVVVLHPRNAHTDGDAMIWLPGHNVLHIGDIYEVDAPPAACPAKWRALQQFVPNVSSRASVQQEFSIGNVLLSSLRHHGMQHRPAGCAEIRIRPLENLPKNIQPTFHSGVAGERLP